MYNFKIQAFARAEYPDKKKVDVFNLHDVVKIWVFADSEKEAVKKARAIIKRKFYRVARVDEHLHSNP